MNPTLYLTFINNISTKIYVRSSSPTLYYLLLAIALLINSIFTFYSSIFTFQLMFALTCQVLLIIILSSIILISNIGLIPNL